MSLAYAWAGVSRSAWTDEACPQVAPAMSWGFVMPEAGVPKTGSTTARGYGARHQAERAKVKVLVDSGQAHCWRCGALITPNQAWDLGHDDDDRSVYRGPEHRGCNRGAAGRRGASITNRKRVMTVRDW